jgi:bifunctional non-homologous end joining protein LigD
VEQLSRVVGAVAGDLVSWAWEKRARGGKARLDFTQNAINKTLVAPYSVRASDGAPVSVPIAWDELDDPGLRPDGWTIRTVGARLETVGDPMAGALGDRQRLPSLDDGARSTPASRDALYAEARQRKIPGRSKMTRDELAHALGHD